jgi:hypothetical protein
MATRRGEGPDYRALYGLRDAPLRYVALAPARSFKCAAGNSRRCAIFQGPDDYWVVWVGDAAKLLAAGLRMIEHQADGEICETCGRIAPQDRNALVGWTFVTCGEGERAEAFCPEHGPR